MTHSLRGACRAALTALTMTLGVTGAGLAGQISIVSAPASAETSTQGDAPSGGQPAQLSGPIEPADAAYLIAGAWGSSLKAAGYEQREYFASGTAYSYQATGPENNVGTWKVAPATSAHYRTRIVVHMPTNPSRFNGTVVVEWLNVSGGGDGAVDSVYLSPELERAGFAWGGRLSAAGGNRQPAPTGIPRAMADRWDPGDQYSYDIYTQAARALLVGGHASSWPHCTPSGCWRWVSPSRRST